MQRLSPGSYCGCCGRRISECEIWCRDCESHIAKLGHLWDQTYEAVNGEPCPYQEHANRT